jgi:hypothetical protein
MMPAKQRRVDIDFSETSVLLAATPFDGKGLLWLATAQWWEIVGSSGGDALGSADAIKPLPTNRR